MSDLNALKKIADSKYSNYIRESNKIGANDAECSRLYHIARDAQDAYDKAKAEDPLSKPTVSKLIRDLQPGDIVHAHQARFKILAVPTIYPVKPDDQYADGGDVANVPAKWLDGAVERGYFGPDKDWTFQGNNRVKVAVEI